MTTLTVELNINGQKQIIQHAVTVEMDEIASLPFAEARRYVDEKVKRWIADTVKFTWTVEQPHVNVTEHEQVAA